MKRIEIIIKKQRTSVPVDPEYEVTLDLETHTVSVGRYGSSDIVCEDADEAERVYKQILEAIEVAEFEAEAEQAETEKDNRASEKELERAALEALVPTIGATGDFLANTNELFAQLTPLVQSYVSFMRKLEGDGEESEQVAS